MTKSKRFRMLVGSVLLPTLALTLFSCGSPLVPVDRQESQGGGLKIQVNNRLRAQQLSNQGLDSYGNAATGVQLGRSALDFAADEMIVYVKDDKKFKRWCAQQDVTILNDSRTDGILPPGGGDAKLIPGRLPVQSAVLISVKPKKGDLNHLREALLKRGIKGDLQIAGSATADLLDTIFSVDEQRDGFTAETNYVAHAQSMTSPDFYHDMDGFWDNAFHSTSDVWHLGGYVNNYQSHGIYIDSVWQHGYTGYGQTIAIIDTGFAQETSDYANAEYASYDPVTQTSNPLRNTFSWWNFSQDGSQTLGSAGAQNYHGNAVASLAIGAAGNHYGGAGVAPLAKVFLMQVGWTSGGALSYYDAGRAVATAQAYGATVINMSFGFPIINGWGVPGTQLGANLQQAANAGIINVAAAGDYGDCRPKGQGTNCNGNYPVVPAAWNTVISVGSYDKHGLLFQSSYGPGAEIFAPGESLTVAPSPRFYCWYNLPKYNYHRCAKDNQMTTSDAQYFGATSGAAPIFAGVVALMKQANPSITQADILHIIDINMSTSGYDVRVLRMLNAEAGVRQAYKLKYGTMPW